MKYLRVLKYSSTFFMAQKNYSGMTHANATNWTAYVLVDDRILVFENRGSWPGAKFQKRMLSWRDYHTYGTKSFCDKWENLEGWCNICHMQKLLKQNSEVSHGCNNEFPQTFQSELAQSSVYQKSAELNMNSKNKRKSSIKEVSKLVGSLLGSSEA